VPSMVPRKVILHCTLSHRKVTQSPPSQRPITPRDGDHIELWKHRWVLLQDNGSFEQRVGRGEDGSGTGGGGGCGTQSNACAPRGLGLSSQWLWMILRECVLLAKEVLPMCWENGTSTRDGATFDVHGDVGYPYPQKNAPILTRNRIGEIRHPLHHPPQGNLRPLRQIRHHHR